MTKIGLGTAAIGRPQYINVRKDSSDAPSSFNLKQFHAAGIAMLEAAYQAGIRYFDTSPGYALAEQMLIDWLSQTRRNDIEIATKWGYTYVANFDLSAKVHEVKEHTLEKLTQQWDQSKKLLPYLTVYQIHSATFETGVLDNMPVLEMLAQIKQEHNIKIGATVTGSNQNEVLRKALSVKIDGNPLFDLIHATYNVFDQSIASDVENLRKSDVQLVVKEALANGRVFASGEFKHYQPHYNLLTQLANKYNTGIDAIAIRFVMDSIHPFVVLSGAASEKYLKQNIEAYNFQLEPGEIEQLQKLKMPAVPYWNERSKLNFN